MSMIVDEEYRLRSVAHLTVGQQTYTLFSMRYTDLSDVRSQLQWRANVFITNAW